MDRAQNLLFLIVQIEIYWFQGLKAMERGTLGTFSASAARGLHFKLGSWNRVFRSPKHQVRVHMQANIQ